MSSDLHVVLGAHGSAGSALVRELRTRELPVRAVTRRDVQPDDVTDGVEWVTADCSSADFRSDIYNGAKVVYLAAQPLYTRWSQDFPPLVEEVLASVARAKARLVHVDNAYAYGRVDGELTEDLPYRPVSEKGRVRTQIAERCMSAHARGEAVVTIGRASDFFGPNVGGSTIGDTLFADLLDNKTVQWIGSLDVPHSVSFIDDVARALVTLGTSDQAWGQVWHLPCAPAPTGRDFLSRACSIAERPIKIGVHGRLAMTIAGWFSALVSEIKEELHQFERPWVLNSTKFQRAFAPFEPTPLEEALRHTIDWYQSAWYDQRNDSE